MNLKEIVKNVLLHNICLQSNPSTKIKNLKKKQKLHYCFLARLRKTKLFNVKSNFKKFNYEILNNIQ